MKVVLLAVAGAAGALSRYGLAVAIGVRSFPWTTLGINLTGSFLLGLVLHLGEVRHWPETTTIPIAIGFLGAFTTFSTFSYELHTMLRNDRAGAALAYAGLSLAGGLAAAAAGYASARSLA